MSRKFLIIANPKAGAFGSGNIIKKITDFFTQKGIGYLLKYTTKSGDYGIKPQNGLEGITDILVVGGDGTVSATVNAFINQRLPIGIVPAGTGNDFIKNLNIPKKLDDALQVAVNGNTVLADCGLCNNRYFVNGVGIGFDGKVVEHMLNSPSFWKGHLAYLSTAVKILAMYRESQLAYSYDHSQVSENVFLMTIANGTTFGGGFKMTPNAKIDDGMLDVCMIKQIHPIKRFLKINTLKTGKHASMKEVEFFNVEDISIEPSDVLSAHLDGDFIGKPPFKIKVIPKAVLFRTGN
jgi:diacylglycerol kinase (ATP)